MDIALLLQPGLPNKHTLGLTFHCARESVVEGTEFLGVSEKC